MDAKKGLVIGLFTASLLFLVGCSTTGGLFSHCHKQEVISKDQAVENYYKGKMHKRHSDNY